ncbi:rhodanese-like domain-containing protein [Aliiglaciecola litoralis]|uniref:Rhodanese-like domain-containing protein n=1 Tax=Aliiglaciecola litoralis TaxID=582857 RepID=A0ABN1LBX8_9ALTE
MISYAEYVDSVKQEITEVTPQWLHEHAKDNLIIIDVRDHFELSSGQIPGAVPISRGMLEGKISALPQFESRNSAGLDSEVPIILYCQSGARSALSAKSLANMGIKNVKSLRGGFKSWKECQLPVA